MPSGTRGDVQKKPLPLFGVSGFFDMGRSPGHAVNIPRCSRVQLGCSRNSDGSEMLDLGWLGEEGADDGAPGRKQRAAAEMDGVILQRRSLDLQQIAFWRFNAALNLGLDEALGLADHAGDPVLDGGFKGSVLAGLDADVGDFENHVRDLFSGFRTGE